MGVITVKKLNVIDRIEILVRKCSFVPKKIFVSADRFDLIEEIKLYDNIDFKLILNEGIYKMYYKNIPIITENKNNDIYLTNY